MLTGESLNWRESHGSYVTLLDVHPDTACEEFAGRYCWSKHFETKLSYFGEHKRLDEAVLDTHACDEDPDLVERGGLPGARTLRNGAPITVGRFWKSYTENM